MIKEKKSLKETKTPSRRKFFKAAAATGAAAATAVAIPNVAFGAPLTLKMQAACIFNVMGAALAILGIATAVAAAAPVTAAALKNLRLEGVLVAFRDFLSLIIISPLLS